MDPTLLTHFATIASLAASFVSERRAHNDASLEEFKVWLADKRHDEIVLLLDSNWSTAIGIKALLHESSTQIIDRLQQLELLVASTSVQAECGASQECVDVTETIRLGVNNDYTGTDEEIDNLSVRCAIHVIEGKKVAFKIALQETVLSELPDDPLTLPRYEKERLERARALEVRLEILTSQAVHAWWQFFLLRKEDWASAMKTLILGARVASGGNVPCKKIDVWRTEEPILSAPIYLNSHEVSSALLYLDFQSTADLRMGPFWRAALDLPSDLIVGHVIPNIVIQLQRMSIPAEGKVLDLSAWHIGEG